MRAIDIVIMALPAAAIIGAEVTRSIVHKRRERRYGIGGTQDIAMWGTFLMLALAIFALVWTILHRRGA